MFSSENQANPGIEQAANPIVWPPSLILVFLLLCILFSSMLGLGIIYALGAANGLAYEAIFDLLNESSTASDRNFVRLTVMINHLSMFVLPAIAVAVFLFRKTWMRFLHIDQSPKGQQILWGSLLILVALPLAQFSFWLNKQIELPAWASSMEEQTGQMVNQLLQADYGLEVLFNVLIIALIPAIGEELVFRGILQKQIERQLKEPIGAIWLSAILFSAFHLQFEGFLPRMLLGALLGYLLYWTGNLWVPIVAHFFNNASQVIVQYLYKAEFDQIDAALLQQGQWLPAIISLLLVLGISRILQQQKSPKNHQPPDAGGQFKPSL
ncbi:MAG: type II CAAX endopeptidase family protein [Bacteroidota bacterium]